MTRRPRRAFDESTAILDATDDQIAPGSSVSRAPRRSRAWAPTTPTSCVTAQSELDVLGAPARGWSTAFRLAALGARWGRRRLSVLERALSAHLTSHLIDTAASHVDELVAYVNTRG